MNLPTITLFATQTLAMWFVFSVADKKSFFNQINFFVFALELVISSITQENYWNRREKKKEKEGGLSLETCLFYAIVSSIKLSYQQVFNNMPVKVVHHNKFI